MNDYLIILGVLGYSNTISFERMVDEYKCDLSSLQVMIMKDIINKFEREGSNVLVLSPKGRKLYHSLSGVIDLAMFS